MIFKSIYFALPFSLLFIGCSAAVTEPCSTLAPQSAMIAVAVDWSGSGLVDASMAQQLDVHRLSLRFYPSDGSDPFERYLEVDLYSGSISVPIGSYSVVALNESISDTHWSGVFAFSNVDSYSDLSAELVTSDDGESGAAKQLASWSIDNFEVTANMTLSTYEVYGIGDKLVEVTLSKYEQEQLDALLGIVMLPLTRNLNVSVTVENLGSAQQVTASVSGLARSINIVTGSVAVDPTTHSFELDSYLYDAESRSEYVASADDDGVVSASRVCLGHSDSLSSDYELNLSVNLIDGSTHYDDDMLTGVDISSTITQTASDSDYNVEHEISLPIVEGESVSVEEWESGGDIELI